MRSFFRTSLIMCWTVLVLGAVAGLTPAKAVPVSWTLQDWTFNDGGEASGSFVYDADTNLFSDMVIVTTNGSARTGAPYFDTISGGNTAFSAVANASVGDLSFFPNLVVMFAEQLTNLGGIVDVSMAMEATCENAACNFLSGPMRFLEGGSVEGIVVASTPIPAALPLFLTGLVALVAVGRRKRTQGGLAAA